MNVPQTLFLLAVIGVIVTMAVMKWTLALQVALGVILVVGLYKLILLIMKNDQLVVTKLYDSSTPQRVRIIDGYAMTATAADHVWTTVMPDADNYAPLKRSMNRKGGAQFTYQFWLFVGDESKGNVGDRIILLRGDGKTYKWDKNLVNAEDAQKAVIQSKNATDLMSNIDALPGRKVKESGVFVKCPLIRFGPTYDSFVVEMNTLHDPNVKINISPYAAKDGIDGTLRSNLLKLSTNKWMLHTFVFEDNVAITDFEDGIVMRYYVNDTLYHTARVPSTLRQNQGDLYLMPSSTNSFGRPVKDCKIGNLFYYNYAIGPDDVREAFKGGPPRKMSTDLMGSEGARGDPLYLAEYNKLDVYNA